MKCSPSEFDVIVAGAGPAGSVAAYLLSRAGKSVLLLDRAKFPREKVCGGCLNAAAVALLSNIGVKIGAMNCSAIGSVEVRSLGRSASVPLPGGVIVSRALLDHTLANAAVSEGTVFEDGAHVAKIQADVSGVSVTVTRDGASRNVGAKLFIEATGLHSTVDVESERVEEVRAAGSLIGAATTLIADAEVLSRGKIFMNVGRGGYVGLVEYAGGRLHLAAALHPDAIRSAGGTGALAQSILRSCNWQLPGVETAHWRGTPGLTRQRKSLAGLRHLVIGDAGGYVEPFSGEGMLWAIGSAVDCVPFAVRAVSDWMPSIADEWNRASRRTRASQQRSCRALAWSLRHETIVGLGIVVANVARPVAVAIAARIANGGPRRPSVSLP